MLSIMPSDVYLLLTTAAAFLIVGLPLIRSKVTLRGRMDVAEVSEAELTDVQRDFFKDHDAKLAELGYAPLCSYRLTNLGAPNISRMYSHASDQSIAVVAAITGGDQDYRAAVVVREFIHAFSGGGRLITRCSPFSSVMKNPPEDVVQEFPSLSDPADLKARHARAFERLGRLALPPGTAAELFKRAAEHHRRVCEYQVGEGLMTYDAATDTYRATNRMGLVGIANFINPFADNFTVARFVAALLGGLAMPVAAAVFGDRLAAALGTALGLDPALALLLILAAAYAEGGFTIGVIFEGKSFIWAFIAGFLCARVLPQPGHPIIFSLIMAFAAHAGAKWRQNLQRIA